MPGRKRTPGALLALRGRRDRNAEVRPEVGLAEADPPPHLPAEVAEKWSQLAPILVEMRVLSVADLTNLELLCTDLAQLDVIEAAIRRDGPLVRKHYDFCPARQQQAVCTCTAPSIENPAMRAKEKVWKRIHSALGDFGMTPTMREKVTKIKKVEPQEDSARRFFGNRGG